MNTWLAHHGIPGMKWGVRNGPPYPLNSKTLSKEIYSNANKHEPKITKDISEAFSEAGAKAYGLEHKLKTRESIQRKIDTDAEEKDISVSDAASGIKDAVRYTALSDDNNFVNAYQTIKKSLIDKGYEEVRCRNYFDEYRQGKVKHKSVQSVFKTPDGYSFEVQFQTPSSQKAKDKKVPLYEERRNPKVSPERAKELERLMVELAEGVSDPKDIYTIKSHNGHLAHHGVKGQRWGVRRFQNADGTYTAEGRQRLKYYKQARNAAKTKADVESIIDSMNADDRDKVLAGSDHYLTVEEGASVCKRALKKVGGKPVAFFDLLEDGDELQVVLGTRSGKQYRGKGYGSEVAKQGMDWLEKNKYKLNQKTVVWGVRTDNAGSIRIAEKNGFVRDDSSERDGWVNYTKRIKK